MKEDILKIVKTPCFIWDIDVLNNRIRFIREHLDDSVRIIYAMKANPFLVEFLNQSDDVAGFEVCSMGEFHICEAYGVPMEKIVLSGVNKSPEEMEYIIGKYGNRLKYTIESEGQLLLLQRIAGEQGENLSCLVRLTSGSQFGNDPSVVKEIFRNRESYPNLSFTGIQFFSGTMKKKLKKHEEELDYLDHFIEEIRHNREAFMEKRERNQEAFMREQEWSQEASMEVPEQNRGIFAEETSIEEPEKYSLVEELEYGPGFGITYFEGEDELDETGLLTGFSDLLNNMKFKGQISLEIGRFLAGHCGTYVTSVADKKCNLGQNYLIVDGGINHMNYYGQMMGMKVPHHDYIPLEYQESLTAPGGEIRNEERKYTIFGSLCTTSDVLVREMVLPSPEIGDRIAFYRIGAYSVTEGIHLFLSRDLPGIYAYSEKEGLELLRSPKDTYQINSRNR